MRKLIIKYFILTKKNDLRLGLTNTALFSAASLSTVYLNAPVLSSALWLSSAFFLFVTFVYFRIWPAKWDELSPKQRWNYGMAVRMQQTTVTLTPLQWKEWYKLNDIYG